MDVRQDGDQPARAQGLDVHLLQIVRIQDSGHQCWKRFGGALVTLRQGQGGLEIAVAPSR